MQTFNANQIKQKPSYQGNLDILFQLLHYMPPNHLDNQLFLDLPLCLIEMCLIYFGNDDIFNQFYTKDKTDLATYLFILADMLRLHCFL